MTPSSSKPLSVREDKSSPSADQRGGDPLHVLHVIDRLEIGPVRVQRNRLVAPYTVVQGDKTDTTDLVYSYEEDVFDPQDAASQNLACLAAAQVALNYGLFCDEIVFRGHFDAADRRFLEDMAENTAREIYVNKFLKPNPFLRGPAAQLPVVKQQKYLHARLVFDPGPSPEPNRDRQGRVAHRFSGGGVESRPVGWAPPPSGTAPPDRDRYVILSSGGKDSLLSYGLLAELRRDVHCVFVNESGKHWFTAINAYRHFQAHVPNTARVWTNADRVFSWMLRHMPFIRPDFLSVRSDEYAIRLWTVAVFLFGVLPLARKRRAGRIIIGDEFDTSERGTHEGITHYNGLFDQSRHFDNALTRYYARKGWGTTQFSLLRPMGELLIEKTLSQRYPELLRLQMSCHATHMSGDMAAPCGRCEKCRRVVGMLTAVGADPKLCGYTPEQVAACLKSLAEGKLHQEREGTEQLAFMLAEKGVLHDGRIGNIPAQARPHTLQLRFERERSPLNAIPIELRGPLYRILLQHTQGAVERSGRVWVKIDPCSDASLSQPYRFDAPEPSAPPPGEGGPRPLLGRVHPVQPRPRSSKDRRVKGERRKVKSEMPIHAGTARPVDQSHILGHLTWPEAQSRFRKIDIALLPVGAIEQHGPHLPLDTDAFDAQYMAERVAEACTDPKPFVLPPVPYGVSYHHDDFPGTISVTNDTLAQFVYDIGMSVARNGITKLIIVNGHGGNMATLHFAAQMINRDARIFTCVDSGETSDADISSLTETPNDVHAGEVETSTTLAVRPELVRMDKASKYIPRFSSKYLEFSSKRSVDWYARTMNISKSGVMGDPTKATREKGQRMWEVMIRNLVELVEHLKGMSLDEIHQRNRY